MALLLVGSAVGCTVLGIGAASAAVLRLADAILPRRLAPAVVATGYFAAAGVLGGPGAQRLRAVSGDWRQFST